MTVQIPNLEDQQLVNWSSGQSYTKIPLDIGEYIRAIKRSTRDDRVFLVNFVHQDTNDVLSCSCDHVEFQSFPHQRNQGTERKTSRERAGM